MKLFAEIYSDHELAVGSNESADNFYFLPNPHLITLRHTSGNNPEVNLEHRLSTEGTKFLSANFNEHTGV